MGRQYKFDLFISFAGEPTQRRPISAHRRIPRSGKRVLVTVNTTESHLEAIYLLIRRDSGDMILAASDSTGLLEGIRAKLRSPELYELVSVPVIYGT